MQLNMLEAKNQLPKLEKSEQTSKEVTRLFCC
jgi:hypothetical protein